MRPSQVLAEISRVAWLAGASLQRDFARREQLEIHTKRASDFVSSADLRSQEIIRSELTTTFPDHALLLEEGSPMSQSRPNRLIVDPLDGTTNFLHGIPHFAVSIALEHDGQVVAAVVLDVAKQELYRAELGAGAWLGDRPLRVSQETAFERSLVGTGIPHHGNSGHDVYLEALANVMRDVAGVRRMGAAALDLAYVAAGRFEAFFELGLAPWDLAGGILLVCEAGGVVTKTDGEPVRLDDGDVLATTPALHPGMLAKLAPLQRAGRRA